MLLLHGNPSHAEHFAPIMPVLGWHAGVIAYDHPGFGRSTWFAEGRSSLERSARLAVAVLDALGVTEPVDVIGHSHGGLVALALGALAPGRVRSILTMGTGAAPAPTGYQVLRAVPALASVLSVLGRPLAGLMTGLVVRHSFAPDTVPTWFTAQQIAELRARPEILGAMVRLAQDDPGAKATQLAGSVRAPVLVVHGSQDGLVDVRHARRLSELLPQCEGFVEVPGGHMVHIAHPERMAPVLEQWLLGDGGR